MNTISLVSWLVMANLIAASPALARGSGLDGVRYPVGAELSWVGKNIKQNGLTLDIQIFRSNQSAEDVLNFYRHYWADNTSDNSPGYLEESVGGWSLISTFSNGYSIVLQIQRGLSGESKGYISALNTNQRISESPGTADLPLPHGSELLSSTHATDVVKHGLTLIAVNSSSVEKNYLFFRSKMLLSGWQLTTADIRSGAAALMFEKENTFCEISINSTESGITMLLVNRVKNGA